MRRHLAPLALLAALLPAARADTEPLNTPPKGFTALFNGKDLTGWKTHDGKLASWGTDKGVLFVKGGGGGWLMTEKEYGDFELHLDFKVPRRGNSGVALRSPLKGDPAYTGMEIQILDDPSYKNLQKWQHTGSIYGVVPPSKVATRPVGEWNTYKITCQGRRVTVELNGEKGVEADLDHYTAKDAKAPPGILRQTGPVGL